MFPPEAERPLRIELFGDDVESMRRTAEINIIDRDQFDRMSNHRIIGVVIADAIAGVSEAFDQLYDIRVAEALRPVHIGAVDLENEARCDLWTLS